MVHQLISACFESRGVAVWEHFLVGENVKSDGVTSRRHFSSPELARGKGIWRFLPNPLPKKISNALLNRKIELVVGDGLGVARMLYPVMGRLDKLRLMVVIHGMVKFRSDDMAELVRYANRVRLVPVSTQLAAQIAQHYPELKNILRPVSNTLNPDFRSNLLNKREARAVLGLPVQGRLSVVTARLIQKKNVSLVIQAFAADEMLDHYLVIIGDGPDKAALVDLVNSLGIAERVIWLGWIPDASCYLRAFDMFVSASVEEGFGLSVLEAHAAGLPVVCTGIPAHEEALQGEGYYFEVGDTQACAKLMAAELPPSGDCNLEARYRDFCEGYHRVYRELCSQTPEQ